LTHQFAAFVSDFVASRSHGTMFPAWVWMLRGCTVSSLAATVPLEGEVFEGWQFAFGEVLEARSAGKIFS